MNTSQTSSKFADWKLNVPFNSENLLHCRCLFCGKEKALGSHGTVLGYLVWQDEMEVIVLLSIFELLRAWFITL